MTRKRRTNENTLQSAFRRSAREWLYMKTRNMAKTYTRPDKVLLNSDYYDTQGWGCLRKCWLGYKIAKSEGDDEKMVYYAKGIQRLQKDLRIDLTDFSHLGLVTLWSTDDEDSNNCTCDSEISNQYQVEYGEIYDDETTTNGSSSIQLHDTNHTTNGKINRNEEFTNIDNYEEYVSNLPMGVEPPSKDDFYKENNSNTSRRPFY